MRPPPRLGVSSEVARGRQLFGEAGCAACHLEGSGTDGEMHALGASASVDTPTLRFISGTAPYFHDGRYLTLEDLLADPDSKMGTSAALPASDRDALAAYLETL
ncbi:MAG: c-type cytochrome [Polyangiaceae bacterium]